MIYLAVALFVLGLVLALVEVLIPSFGLFTLMCCGCIVGSVAIAFGVGNTAGIAFIVASFIGVPVTVLLGFKLLRTSRFGNRILLAATDTRKTVDSIYEDNTSLIGRQGIAVSSLRPSGTIDIDGERVPVVTEGDRVAKGRTVEVIAVEGNRIVVRPTEPAQNEEDDEED